MTDVLTMLIDPPGFFAPIEEWREHLASLESIEQPAADVRAAIADAKRVIAEKENPT